MVVFLQVLANPGAMNHPVQTTSARRNRWLRSSTGGSQWHSYLATGSSYTFTKTLPQEADIALCIARRTLLNNALITQN